MITLELTEQEAWFLTELFDSSLRGIFSKELFKTRDEDDKLTYDEDFVDHIKEIESRLYEARELWD